MEPEPIEPVASADADMRIDYGEGDDEVFMDGGEDVEADAEMIADEAAGVAPQQLEETDMGDWEEEGDNSVEVPMIDAAAEVAEIEEVIPDAASSPVTIDDPPPRPHPGFASPPHIQASDNGLQISALGHTAASELSPTTLAFSHNPSVVSAPFPSPLAPVNDAPLPPPPAAEAFANVPTVAHVTALDHPPAVAPVADGISPPEPSSNGRSNGNGITTLEGQQRDDLDPTKALAVQHQHTESRGQTQDQSMEHLGSRKFRVHQSQSEERAIEGEEPSQENEIIIRETTASDGGEDNIDISMEQKNKGGDSSSSAPVRQVNHVKVYRRGEDCASGTSSGGTVERPDIKKSLLSHVDLTELIGPEAPTPEEAGDGKDHSELFAPLVLISYNNETYSLFGSEYSSDLDPSLPSLFSEQKDHELYYDQIETFFEALHEVFPELAAKEDELVLSFEAIGISLTEDNVYTREVCLYDFDRIHVGCGLPGRLHVTIEHQPRFSTGFNALAQHIANSYEPDEPIKPTTDETEHQQDETFHPDEHAEEEVKAQAEDQPGADGDDENETGGTVLDTEQKVEIEELTEEVQDVEGAGAPDDEEVSSGEAGEAQRELEGDVVNADEFHLEREVGGSEGEFEDGEWFDAGGEDETTQEGDPERENFQGEEEGDYDAIETLADLDNDDLTAVIEGAQEDYLLSETLTTEDVAEGESFVEGDLEGALEAATVVEPDREEPLVSEEANPSVSSSNTSSVTATEVATSSIDPLEDVGEELADENDVVIDYEEVFDAPSQAPSPIPPNNPESTLSEHSPRSPKRSRDSELAEEDAPSSGDTKRARLDSPSPAASALAP